MNKQQNSHNFYDRLTPIKLTEAQWVKVGSEGWGLLTDYWIESVKITHWKGKITSSATLRVGDISGEVTCVVRGPSTGLLFGLTTKEWQEVENMCNYKDQLFYRYFKNGINKNFSLEQKMFYNFCMSNQKNDVLVAKFRRSVNTRNKFKSDVFLEILELSKYERNLFDLYVNKLKTNL